MNIAQLEDMKNRMINWARWALSEGNVRHRCASAEGQYRPMAVDDDKHEYERAGVIDFVEAEMIEGIVSGLSHSDRTFLREHFVKRVTLRLLAKKAYLSVEATEALLQQNLERVAKQLADRKGRASSCPRLHFSKCSIMTSATN